ncbi:MAG TPA: enolase C-terminal domain-like protein [Thermomicrobiales bacterium]|nr:enolase C-terminal domain-like protein [Thermomicrobiales bacterium]
MSRPAIRILNVETFFSPALSGGVFGFGAAAATDLTLAHVRVTVEGTRGGVAEGWGAIILSWPWAFPDPGIEGATRDRLMREMVDAFGRALVSRGEWGHPLDHFLAMEPELGSIAADTGRQLGVSVPVPALCAKVAYSPIDAAIHDAYGMLLGLNSFRTMTGEHMSWDLSRLLGPGFAGRYPSDFVRPQPVARLPIAHTVGAFDPLTPGDIREGSISPLTGWIERDGVTDFKVKLRGQDLEWDIARLVDVYRVACETHAHAARPLIFGDLNEQAPSRDYIVELLDRLETDHPAVYRALDALEQPMSRELDDNAPDLRDVSTRVPVVLDEGLASLEAIDTARARGWNGIALKTCKTQSLMMLALAKATEAGMHISVQDLSNPGIALLHSASLASRLPVTRAMESNANQYFPDASAPEAAVFPETFVAHEGRVATGELTGPGLGYRIHEIERDLFAQV